MCTSGSSRLLLCVCPWPAPLVKDGVTACGREGGILTACAGIVESVCLVN